MNEPSTIVTINTWKGDGAYRQRMIALARGLRELEPAVVALQEAFVCDGSRADTAGGLACALDMEMVFTPARYKKRLFEGVALDSLSGMAMLSASRWLEFYDVPLPCDPADGQRIAQVGLTTVAREPLVVANVHLTHLPGADDLRIAQLHTLFKHPLIRHSETPVVLCGDFNSIAADTLVRGVARSLGIESVDTWGAGGGEGPRGTIRSGWCVDYIFALTKARGPRPAFEHSTLALNAPSFNGVAPSDHFGVATRFAGVLTHV